LLSEFNDKVLEIPQRESYTKEEGGGRDCCYYRKKKGEETKQGIIIPDLTRQLH